MKNMPCELAEIGARMRFARESLGLSQAALAKQYGCSDRTYQKNESGLNEAGLCLIGLFIRAGINANWLLTGEGPMRLADLAPQPAPVLDADRFRLAVETLEEGLAGTGSTMSPAKRADLVLALYDLFDGADASAKGKLLKFVKLAA